MKIKCDYCGSMVDEKEKSCPNCGAALSGVNRMAKGQPKTIEELKQWYQDRNLPPENVTRFFIGKNIKEPKAFGIYRDEKGDFVVYKNKSDGQRAVRYQGSDEAYAVNELYQRLKAEIADQKNKNAAETSKAKPKKPQKSKRSMSGGVIFTVSVIAMLLLAIFDKSPSRGYYRYNNRDYYYQDSCWYYYDDTADDWYRADNGSELSENITFDTQDDFSISDHTGKSFEDTSWYDSNDDSSWDSDSDWSSGDSWDSGSTDWSSDW